MQRLIEISYREWFISLSITVATFLLFDTVTALWSNPFFIRMTEVSDLDYVILGFETILIGLFFGIRAPKCAVKKAGFGGIFGFLGFGCSLCNKLLLLLFGSSFLLTYFEPIRYYVGVTGILIFSFALFQKLSLPVLDHAEIKTDDH
ncbi:MAG TPA: hypothetical protein EYM80_05010 [Deltaproteobacteria bacterium]|nr:hypothetical protein [Deltaproteobacteria bacterium]HIA57311.1 hypothetical protein [Candidatus Lambdaproteobacteria bacterium]HIB92800.1 hypothetical protein [Candidatus Lambdaproteobacteria bacterium]HIN47567.1 hypothetical protein [Deltaproteobacteria bacterium]HIO61196.1 hypothetical protein [Deltaproteobacteria bacterium]